MVSCCLTSESSFFSLLFSCGVSHSSFSFVALTFPSRNLLLFHVSFSFLAASPAFLLFQPPCKLPASFNQLLLAAAFHFPFILYLFSWPGGLHFLLLWRSLRPLTQDYSFNDSLLWSNFPDYKPRSISKLLHLVYICLSLAEVQTLLPQWKALARSLLLTLERENHLNRDW